MSRHRFVEYRSVKEWAKELGCSYTNLWYHIQRGDLPVLRLSPNRNIVLTEHFHCWVLNSKAFCAKKYLRLRPWLKESVDAKKV